MEYLKEIKEKIDKFIQKGLEYGKPLDYLLKRNGVSDKSEFELDIKNLEKLVKIVKQEYSGELRYLLYFVYSGKKGRAYIITFRDKLRLVTIFPLGKKTLKKYKKARFK